MVAFPAVPAPTALIAARIACRLLDSLAHHSGKRNQARPTRLALNFGSDLSRAGAKSCKALCRPHPKKKRGSKSTNFLLIQWPNNSADPLIAAKFTGSL
jgi:hypothetical protein